MYVWIISVGQQSRPYDEGLAGAQQGSVNLFNDPFKVHSNSRIGSVNGFHIQMPTF